MKRKISLWGLLVMLVAVAGLAVLAGCSESEPAEADAEEVVYTTFYPTTYFAETISHGTLKVVCPCPPDEDAIFWMPDRQTLMNYQQADLIVINGAEFEKWVGNVSLPQERIVDTARSLTEPLVEFEQATTHSHGPAGEHSHTGIDGHTWVDPVNAVQQAQAIRDGFVRRFPQHEQAFDTGFDQLKKQLTTLDEQFALISRDASDIPLLCSHPAYNYIARRYQWNIYNLDLDPESPLTDEQVAEIKGILKTYPAQTLIWESAPMDENIQIVQALGLASVVFSPCELAAPEDLAAGVDYMQVMTENLRKMETVFSGK